MKTILLISIVGISSLLLALTRPESNNNNTFQISYSYTENLAENVHTDKYIELITINANGDTMRKKVPNAGFIKRLKFNLEINARGNNDSSILYINPAKGSSQNIHAPDKLVFKRNKWFGYKNNVKEEIKLIETALIETDEYKIILGYRCRKFTVREIKNDLVFEVWVTPQLPSTLIPGAGFKPFPGAVLEMNFPARQSHFIATAITKLQM